MLTNAKILVVEDDNALAFLFLKQLREFNADVVIAHTADEAIRICEEASSEPDVVIMDIKLVGSTINGIECARRLKHKHKDIQVIFLTAMLEPEMLEAARNVSPAAFVLKDVGSPSAEGLRAMVRVALDQRENLRSLEQSNVRMRRVNMYDPLTQLYNRNAFTTLGPRYLEPGAQAVLFIDMDNLKDINDSHGHAAGDEAIKHFATALLSVFRDDDLVARLSGDEFAVLAKVDKDGVGAMKQRLQQSLALINATGELPYLLAASVGFAMAQDGLSLDDLLGLADADMYEEKAKRKGGNRLA